MLYCYSHRCQPCHQPPSPLPPGLYLCLVALLQRSQVADEAHGEATPLLSLGILSQAVQQYPSVPSPSQQPQGLQLWEVVGLRKTRNMDQKGPFNGGHLGDSPETSMWKETMILVGKSLRVTLLNFIRSRSTMLKTSADAQR